LPEKLRNVKAKTPAPEGNCRFYGGHGNRIKSLILEIAVSATSIPE
jgi:hypothetical protein